MIHLVEEAQEENGKSQLFIETFGGVYFLVIVHRFIHPFRGQSHRAYVLA